MKGGEMQFTEFDPMAIQNKEHTHCEGCDNDEK